VTGTAIDFPTINTLGFASYTISTAAFFYSPVIKRQYAYRHPLSPETTVRFNDLVFAAHGFILCVITWSQFFPAIWGLKVGPSQRASRFILGVFWGSIIGIAIVLLIIQRKGLDGGNDPAGWAWIDAIYALGYVKIVATLVKYCPQVYLNYTRKSTVGWSIWQILLDFIGGILSLLQLVIDSALQADWSGLTGMLQNRCCALRRLTTSRKPSQAWTEQYLTLLRHHIHYPTLLVCRDAQRLDRYLLVHSLYRHSRDKEDEETSGSVDEQSPLLRPESR
jgi:hypothetical protein